MEEKYEIQKTLTGIIESSDCMTFKDQFMVDSLVSEVAKITQTVTLEAIADLQKPLDQLNDAIMEVKSSIKLDYDLQKVFMIGELNAVSKMVLEMSKIIEESVIALGDKKNDFLRGFITAIGKDGVVTHNELAKKLDSNPAALSMRMKRDPTWRKYVSAYTNPTKGNSVIYILNKSGDEMYRYFDKTENIWSIYKNSEKRDYANYLYTVYNFDDLGGFTDGRFRKTNPISEYRKLELQK